MCVAAEVEVETGFHGTVTLQTLQTLETLQNGNLLCEVAEFEARVVDAWCGHGLARCWAARAGLCAGLPRRVELGRACHCRCCCVFESVTALRSIGSVLRRVTSVSRLYRKYLLPDDS